MFFRTISGWKKKANVSRFHDKMFKDEADTKLIPFLTKIVFYFIRLSAKQNEIKEKICESVKANPVT